MSDRGTDDAARLEALWQGSFGDTYTERNAAAAAKRDVFWTELLTAYPCERVLEVGCNLGANLKWISNILPARDVFGIDVNESALMCARSEVPGVNALWAKARDLPFRDGYFDLVFTAGVLIHQSPAGLTEVMSEIVRCSRRYVLAAEYFAETLTEVSYRGQTGALYKADFGGIYQQRHPGLRLVRKGFLPRSEGWDDLTYWLFEKAP